MTLSKDEIRDMVINFLNQDMEDIKIGVSIDFVRGEISAVAYMLEMLNMPKLADIVERHFSAKLYKLMQERIDYDEYEET